MIQTVAWVSSLFFILIIAAVFAWVFLNSKKKENFNKVVKKWYKTRKVYGVIVVLLMLVVTIYTLRELPYNAPVYEAGTDVHVVDVEAIQFGWNISQTEFSVGDSVEFNVTTPDVTHGFGIYNEDMELIAQTQAMPEYTNTVYMTFSEAGTYTVLCLEYCGLGHHLMMAELIVE